MARKGIVLWEVRKEWKAVDYVGVLHYALRESGVLLEKYETRNFDGSQRHSYGWKVAARKPRPDALETLKAKGFA